MKKKPDQTKKNINELRTFCRDTEREFTRYAHNIAWEMQFKEVIADSTKSNFIKYSNRAKFADDVLEILNQKPQ